MPTPSRLLSALAFVAALGLPLALSDFQIFQATQILIYAIAILGLNIATGFNGQISLGHGAFYAVGAYVVAILTSMYDVPYGLALVFAGATCLVMGFAFGLPALRLEGHYLALATFALAIAVPQLLKYPPIEHWTGGVQGLFIAKPEAPLGLPLNADQWLYYFTLFVGLALFVFAGNLLTGRIGRAIVAIRDHQIAAHAMGINVPLVKAMTFAVSAAYTGVAGGLSAIVIQFVAPDSFTLFLSIFLLVGVVVGGVASVPGALVGATFIVIVPNIAADVSKVITGAVYGTIMIAFMFLMPDGVWGALRAVGRRLSGTRGAGRRV